MTLRQALGEAVRRLAAGGLNARGWRRKSFSGGPVV
ncbi:HemK family modification methylase [Moorella thermoacetica Y72]|uniref:HemK family modification methylase n=1 Tax=Moorella thermoacetica Y72 TaxID=1325331 RepID=A0A0S6UDJ3_NEOTH|nr:HemK family modification methylase [Moorella thermoacetica Y72]